MKLFRHGPAGAERPGIVDRQGGLRDLSGLIRDVRGQALDRQTMSQLRDVDLEQLPLLPDDVRLGACVAGVGNFIGVGLNYADHALEAGLPLPKEPVLFNKATSCVCGPYDNVIMPRGGSKLDWEVELAVIIGESCLYVDEDQAMDYVAGFCLCNDVSERVFQMDRGGLWSKGKGCPTFGPLGPWLVTPDEVPDPHNLELWLNVNGERMQSGNTSSMVFKVPALVSYISQFMRLEAGDVIATGTPPGVGMGKKPPRYLKPGDVMELGVAGLGTQRQLVVESN
ncbi:MAG: fumarylacetoacetate hydrolase family protein [Deltaproteobacteria bacterium]|jgi:2-keto-4-pentenoate hydratase/2-oxohepta-3-ene-1,7-dioic acid hydratase in catechol pathway|nr:fumarylacetoacetate hydrolase family protein [Deltaproteobacteria bacterium]